ncbi:BTAD domain-containing putative transcriptional regulator [Streptomyces sp. ITFR-6]|uniref:AfsR/SARP family transcriptional regulator n=1 Tax=Streptomyces sp. ITFR-6 TaxID=3075197 RepID=UPI00288A4186|nr:BTAD domain-containing putative transcriptional regulator [Streptomyces sp. ITFR-6]WNI33213.1 BTAD domain-containing putative transcriptional regulator [Streptomyces sp. ITFR-6]
MSTAEEVRLRFNILGPIEGWSNGTRLRLGGVIQERVLATLLLEPGKVLPVSRLVEAAWDEEPPPTAPHQVRKAVADLRRRIPGGADVLLTDGPGYRVADEQCEIDLAEFGLLIRKAKQTASEGRAAEAAEILRGALALWRGPVLSGGGGPVIEAASTSIEERRLTAAEQLFELHLGLGEAAELVVELRELVQQHPLRESLRGQLMIALYRSGRQAEALDEYGRVRELLVEELGIDPGPNLTKLYEGILRESPELAGPGPAAAPVAPVALPAEPPSTLPYDLSDFTGRDRELAEIQRAAEDGGGQGPQIVAIDGMGGCGKTSLAVRAAHRLAPQYPDGQLHIDLRGYTPGDQPVTAGMALDTLLRALGVPGNLIPDDVPARTALWRATLIGKRLLILFDNAADAATVRPLLPASSGSLIMVTSRARLVDLDGARWISIGVMPPQDSAMLVAETLGAQRVAAEPEAAAELARLCGHLPLALRIATARLRNRPRWTLQYLAERLRDETRRLDELSSGARSVSATLRLSYQALDEECRNAFSTLALHPGSDMDIHAAGALLGTGARDAEDLLEMLLDVHLVQQPEIGLYTFHDLVRSFAQSLLVESAEPAESSDAVERLLCYYLTATEEACDLLYSGRRRRSTGIPPSTAEMPDLSTAQRARTWFLREQTALLAAVTLAERKGHDRYVVCLSRNLVFQLNDLGLLEEFGELSRVAVAAAGRLQDLALLGVSLSNLGVACWKLGRLTEGLEAARKSRDVAIQLGDLHTQAHSESILGQFNSLLGDFSEALGHMETAIGHERDLDMPRAEAESLTILSTLYEQWGRYEEARDAAQRSAELSRQLGQHEGLPGAITDLAFAHVGLGAYEEADRCLAEARALYGDAGNEVNLALTLALSADVDDLLGRPPREPDQAERALGMMRTNSSPLRRAKVENMVGRLRRRQGDTAAALALHTHAHGLSSSLSYRIEEAYALSGMADALGDTPDAVQYRAEAEKLFAALGVPAEHRRG